VDGVPTVYVMEYLDLSTWQKSYQFFNSTKAQVVDPKLRTALNTLSICSNSKICSWGSLNQCDRRTSGSLILTEQWEEEQAYYPAEWNTDI